MSELDRLIDQYDDGMLIDMPLSKGGLIKSIERLISSERAKTIAEVEANKNYIEIPRTITGFQIIGFIGSESNWRSPIYGKELLPVEFRQSLERMKTE